MDKGPWVGAWKVFEPGLTLGCLFCYLFRRAPDSTPIFPDSSTPITSEIAFARFDGRVVYFNGHLPVFTHAVDDIASFRLFSSQLVNNGSATQAQIARAFGVPLITVKRMCAKLRLEGPGGFYKPKAPAKGHKLTPELIVQAQRLLDEGVAVPELSVATGVLPSTLHKAIAAGRLKKRHCSAACSTVGRGSQRASQQCQHAELCGWRRALWHRHDA